MIKKHIVLFTVIFIFYICMYCLQCFFALPVRAEEAQISSALQELISPLSKQPTGSFECYDVAEDGKFALGFQEPNDGHNLKLVGIYDAGGTYLCGFSVSYRGLYALEWEGENILFYRESYDALVITQDGTVVGQKNLAMSKIDYDKLLREKSKTTTRTVDGKTYEMKNDFGVFSFLNGSFSILTVKDTSGNETILYDASDSFKVTVTQTVLQIWLIAAGIAFMLVAIVFPLFVAGNGLRDGASREEKQKGIFIQYYRAAFMIASSYCIFNLVQAVILAWSLKNIWSDAKTRDLVLLATGATAVLLAVLLIALRFGVKLLIDKKKAPLTATGTLEKVKHYSGYTRTFLNSNYGTPAKITVDGKKYIGYIDGNCTVGARVTVTYLPTSKCAVNITAQVLPSIPSVAEIERASSVGK